MSSYEEVWIIRDKAENEGSLYASERGTGWFTL